MSTQRREDRWQRSGNTHQAAARKFTLPAPTVWPKRAIADVGTAPPNIWAFFQHGDTERSPGSWRWMATNSLQLGHRFVHLERLLLKDVRRGSPPFGAVRNPATGIVTIVRFPPLRIPSPPGRLFFTLPQVPAGYRRRAERYDGKRNLYLQHAT
jgi:hypothetical protein